MYFAIMLAGAYQLTRWVMALVDRLEGGSHAHTEAAQ